MKKSANGNMYEVTLAETWELFAPYLSGAASGCVCVVSARPLDDAARGALESSAAALGYGRPGCTYAVLRGEDAKGATLDGQALFLLVEGLDPLVVIAADGESAAALAVAYRQEVALDAATHLFGRPAVAFASFATMLEDAKSKQAAWALLKKLPKFGAAS